MIPLVRVDNEWSRLRRCILGIVSDIYLCPSGLIFPPQTSPRWIVALDAVWGRLFAGRRVPRLFLAGLKKEMHALESTLRSRGIDLLRPDPVTPLAGEPAGLSQMFARDPIIVAGDTIIIGRQRLPALRKEIRGLDRLMARLKASGCRVARVPDSPQGDIFIEGGDVLVDLPYVFVGCGPLASNENGARWLAEQLGGHVSVVSVPIVKPGIFHLDTCLALTGPCRGIVCRAALCDPLPAPLCDYEFVEIDDRQRRQIALNVLMLDEKTVVMQKRHAPLRRTLERRGYETIGLDFNRHALAGGGFRCATHPIVRID